MEFPPTTSSGQTPLTVLCVDDEEQILQSLQRLFRKEEFQVLTATSGDEGLSLLRQHDQIGLILSDQRMPGMSGVNFLQSAAAHNAEIPRFLLTGYADLHIARDAVNHGGISRLIDKPWDDQALLQMVRDALAQQRLLRENRLLSATISRQNEELARWNSDLAAQVESQTRLLQQQLDEITLLKKKLESENVKLREEVKTHQDRGTIIGSSKLLTDVLAQAARVSPTQSTVLILGETGTGKELLAKFIHQNSPRRDQILHKINCAAIPENLVESELFGRERGAFTGAVEQQIGHFELADGSTILLDEIGELPLGAQSKLLRVLQEGEFERVGSPKIHRTNVRVIAATNRDLSEESRAGRFRLDLFYRLNVFPLKLPLLRERIEDIPLLVQSFIDELGPQMGRVACKLGPREMDKLQRYPWPGNIRELRNIIERALIFSSGDSLQVTLPDTSRSDDPSSLSLQDVERRHITTVLESSGWRVHGDKGAARILGLNPNTLFFRMKKLGIPLLRQKNNMP